jgi:hypothetical protein
MINTLIVRIYDLNNTVIAKWYIGQAIDSDTNFLTFVLPSSYPVTTQSNVSNFANVKKHRSNFVDIKNRLKFVDIVASADNVVLDKLILVPIASDPTTTQPMTTQPWNDILSTNNLQMPNLPMPQYGMGSNLGYSGYSMGSNLGYGMGNNSGYGMGNNTGYSSNSINAVNIQSKLSPSTKIFQHNFKGTSNVYSPVIYHTVEKFVPLNSLEEYYAPY